MTKIKHYIEYLLVRFLYWLIGVFPEWMMRAIAQFISILMRFVIHYRSTVIDVNLELAFPDKSKSERKLIKNRFYYHIALFFLEFIRGPKVTDDYLEQRIIIENDDALKKYIGKPALLVSGHIGEFNLWLMLMVKYLGTHLNVIFKDQRNPYTSQMNVDFRYACGQKPIFSKGAIKKCIELLEAKEYIGFLNDQNPWDRGININFFGHEAPTMKGLAIFKEQFDYPILQGYVVRDEKKGMYRFWIDELKVEKSEDQETYYRNILQASNDHLEAAVKRFPDQYLWSHRRWRVEYDELAKL